MKLKEPEDPELFNQRLNIAPQRPSNSDVRRNDNSEPFTTYGLDRITQWNDINDMLDQIYANTPKPFKLRFTFNGIYEAQLGEGDHIYF